MPFGCVFSRFIEIVKFMILEKLKTRYDALHKFSSSDLRNRIQFYHAEFSSGIVGLWNLFDVKAIVWLPDTQMALYIKISNKNFQT